VHSGRSNENLGRKGGGGNGCEVHAVVAEVVTRQCSKTWWKAMAPELSRCARDCNFPSL